MNDPIFIVGCDRSGTTFLGDILGSSSGAFTTPESHFFHELLRLDQLKTLHDPTVFKEFVETNGRLATWGLDNAELLQGYDDSYRHNHNLRELIEVILSLYVKTHSIGRDLDSASWVDHTPDNLLMAHCWKLIFPRCKFIHIVRDGRSVFSSLSRLPWGPSTAHFCSIFWSERVLQGIYLENIYPTDVVSLRYEDIIRRPDEVIGNLCSSIGLIFKTQMLSGGGLNLPEFTRSQHAHVGKGVRVTTSSNWRECLSKKQVMEFENSSFARDCLHHFGYELVSEGKRLSPADLVASYGFEAVGYIKSKLYFRNLNKVDCA